MNRNFSVWQYPQKVDVISTQPERSTPDKWLPQIPDQVRKAVLIIALIPTFFAPPSDAALQNEVSKYGFNKRTFDNPVLPKKQQWTYPSLFETPSTNALESEKSKYGWRKDFDRNPIPVPDKRWQYPYAFEPIFAGIRDEQSKYNWRPIGRDAPIPTSDNRWVYPSNFEPSQSGIANEQAKYNWQPIREDKQKPLADNRWQYPYFFADSQLFTVPGVEDITLDKWYFDYKNPVLPRDNRWTYPYFTIDPFQLTQGERITVDKWFVVTSQPLFDKPKLQFQYPYFFPDSQLDQVPGVENITVDKWFVRTAEPIRVRLPIILEQFTEPPPSLIESDISKLGWRPNFYDNPVLPKKQQWTYPWLAEPPSRSTLEAEIAKYGWKKDYFRNPIPPRYPWYAYPPFAADAQLFQVPVQQASVTVETISFDLYAKQTSVLDLYVVQSRSIDFER